MVGVRSPSAQRRLRLLAYPGRMRAVIALVADVLSVLVFTAVGISQHGLGLSLTTLTWVAWPFLVGMLVGHLAIRAWRTPFGIWPRGVFVWAITVVGGMAIRTILGLGTEVSFVIVTAVVLAVLMLGWRAVARWVTRRERREVISESDLAAASGSRLSEASTEGSAPKGR